MEQWDGYGVSSDECGKNAIYARVSATLVFFECSVN